MSILCEPDLQPIQRLSMPDDERCCGTGTCIIDARGLCWCGQQWDGEKMCRPDQTGAPSGTPDAPQKQPNTQADPLD